MGVVYNSGKALSEQRELLQEKFEQFRSLFPNHHPNWSQIQLTVGQPLQWQDYLDIEAALIGFLRDKSKAIEGRFIDASKYLLSKTIQTNSKPIPEAKLSTDEVTIGSQMNGVDLNLIVALHKVYFPSKPLSRGEGEFSVFRFLWQALTEQFQRGLRIKVPSDDFSIDKLASIPWPSKDDEINDLLYRYFFSRIFAKLYFGAGFGQLSLIAGFHHLALLVALIKLHSRALSLSRGAASVSYLDVIAAIRQLEKRLGELSLGRYAAAVFELLLYSHRRLQRILDTWQ